MATKTTDPVLRLKLHSARDIIIDTSSLMRRAEMNAREGKATEAEMKIREAQQLLYEAEMDILELLAVN